MPESLGLRRISGEMSLSAGFVNGIVTCPAARQGYFASVLTNSFMGDRISLLTDIQSRILKTISPGVPHACSGSAYKGKSKLAILIGNEFIAKVPGKVIIDFGCGEGHEAVEMAERGARRVLGIDIRDDMLQAARHNSLSAGVQDTCLFAPVEDICRFPPSAEECADMVISVDAFEHFADPAEVLRIMDRLLRPEGEAYITFGPTWYHPLGGHLFSVFPWAHLLFSEEALIRWRSTFKKDGATKFSEVAGGLNQMTIAKFEKLVASSSFTFASLELIPIRMLRHAHNRFTREFTTAIVRCRLVRRNTKRN